MKLLKLVLCSVSFSSFLLLLAPLLAVESSSANTLVLNITRGSSLSTALDNDTSHPYWLSPSGKLAFGFYRLPCTSCSPNWSDEYVVGIWFVKSSQQTLVWNANPTDLPLHRPSSILFTDEGKFMLRIMPDNKEKLLFPDAPEPASYAKMNDDGNFVLYGSDSQIIWQSFDYPTDTILGGQKLRPGIGLISGNYRLSVTQTDGYVGIYRMAGDIAESVSVMSNELEDSQSRPVILRLNDAGKLYLASSEDEVVKVFYDDAKRKQQVNKEEEGEYMYRATLSSIGRLNLHEERVDGNDSHDNSIVWSSSPKTATKWDDIRSEDEGFVLVALYSGLPCLVVLLALFLCCKYNNKSIKHQTTGGDVELQRN